MPTTHATVSTLMAQPDVDRRRPTCFAPELQIDQRHVAEVAVDDRTEVDPLVPATVPAQGGEQGLSLRNRFGGEQICAINRGMTRYVGLFAICSNNGDHIGRLRVRQSISRWLAEHARLRQDRHGFQRLSRR